MKTIIIGLTVREAEHHWRELMEVRPDLRSPSSCKVMSVDHAERGLQGVRWDTEVLIHERAWRHKAAPYRLYPAIKSFEFRGGYTAALFDNHP